MIPLNTEPYLCAVVAVAAALAIQREPHSGAGAFVSLLVVKGVYTQIHCPRQGSSTRQSVTLKYKMGGKYKNL